MKKKLLSLFMACAMALSLALPALAVDYNAWDGDPSDELTQTIDIEARTYVPTVRLTLPTFAADNLVLNPYKLDFKVSSDDVLNGQEVANGLDSVRQVISPVYSIKNETDVALKYTVTATTTLGSSAAFTFDTKHVSLTEKTKKAYIALVLKKTESDTAQITNDATHPQELDPYDTANNETIVLAVGAKSSGNSIKKLAAAGLDTAANYLWFQFYGSLSRTPETGWTADDNFSTQLVFTFTPESGQDYTAGAQLTTTSAAGADWTAAEVIDSTAAFDTTAANNKFDNLKDGAGAPVTNPTKISDLAGATPAWSLVSAGAYGATISATDGKVTYPASAGKILNNGDNVDNLVIGFNDKNGVPRTIGVTVTIKHTVS